MQPRQRRPELPDNEEIRMLAESTLIRLNSLGSPRRIYDTLVDSGVKGIRYDSMRSPIGAYVSKVLGGTVITWVSPTWACVYSDKRSCAVWRVPISLGALLNVRAFTKGFDDGAYFTLVDNVLDLH